MSVTTEAFVTPVSRLWVSHVTASSQVGGHIGQTSRSEARADLALCNTWCTGAPPGRGIAGSRRGDRADISCFAVPRLAW